MDNKSDATFSVKYGPKDILDKSFKNKVRGYDPDEVDEFLDGIIRDYESFTAEIDRLNEENNRLFSRVDELTKQLSFQTAATVRKAITMAAVLINIDF